MYKGRRDDHFSFRVPQEQCDLYKAPNGVFVEIKLPGWTDTLWNSFMIKPDQVCYDHAMPDAYNIIEKLNRNARILVSQKAIAPDGTRYTVKGTDCYYRPIELAAVFHEYN